MASTAAFAAKPGAGGQPTIVDDRPLSFGRIALGSAAGTVTVSPSGLRTCSAAIACLGVGAQSGRIEIRGNGGSQVSIGISSDIMLSSGASDQVSVTLTPSVTSMTLQNGNNKNFVTIGGVLALEASSQGGDYAGSYTVTVDYL